MQGWGNVLPQCHGPFEWCWLVLVPLLEEGGLRTLTVVFFKGHLPQAVVPHLAGASVKLVCDVDQQSSHRPTHQVQSCTVYLVFHCTVYLVFHCTVYLVFHCTVYFVFHCTVYLVFLESRGAAHTVVSCPRSSSSCPRDHSKKLKMSHFSTCWKKSRRMRSKDKGPMSEETRAAYTEVFR